MRRSRAWCPRMDRRMVKQMSTRARWIVLGVALVLVLGLAALYWFNSNLTGVESSEVNGRRTWTIQSGDTATLSADEVDPDDRYRCELDGGAYVVEGTPPLGEASWSGASRWRRSSDGTVILSCDPDAAVPKTAVHEARTCGCGPKGIRTPDLLAASQALYQLSYGPGEH